MTRRKLGMISAFPYLGGRVLGVCRYCESVEKLLAYAHSLDFLHQPAGRRRFDARVGTSGDVGIRQETYAIAATNSGLLHVNMPDYGLGTAAAMFAARGARANAAGWLARRVGSVAP